MNGELMLDQIREMHIKVTAAKKIDDEYAAYKMQDQGDSWDQVREQLRAGYEISHLVMSRDIYQKISQESLDRALRNEPNPHFFWGLAVEVDTSLPDSTFGVVLKKSDIVEPRKRNMVQHMINTHTAHRTISMIDMPYI